MGMTGNDRLKVVGRHIRDVEAANFPATFHQDITACFAGIGPNARLGAFPDISLVALDLMPAPPRGGLPTPRGSPMASLIRWLLNQALFNVIPKARCSWLPLTPFLLETMM